MVHGRPVKQRPPEELARCDAKYPVHFPLICKTQPKPMGCVENHLDVNISVRCRRKIVPLTHQLHPVSSETTVLGILPQDNGKHKSHPTNTGIATR